MKLDREEFVKILWETWDKTQQCDVDNDRSTQFDTPEIVKLRCLLAHLPQSLGYSEDRAQLRRSIYNRLITGSHLCDRVAVLLCGLPASRKSMLAEVIREKLNARIVDSDLAKELLPEFNGGRFAQMVHQESDKIRNQILEECLARGENIILPIVGKSHQSVLALFNELSHEGYKVHLRLIDCDPKISAERVVKRFCETGRFVDPMYALDVASKPTEVYDSLKNIPWASRRCLSQEELDAYDGEDFLT